MEIAITTMLTTMLNININTNVFKTLNSRFKIVEFVRRTISVSINLILSQVMVLIDLMIVRLDKNNWSGPVGDIRVIDGAMDNPLDYGWVLVTFLAQ